ncbi:centrosomal protein of 44 kDa isoform X1 [Gadus chalcogrammus]|uniref:centrosomal protein of 44 kDa isoform X1 n=1 Tax=Gadus chalcogrammus TaxID=1042646 RepID=UPI0024C3B4E7|nr:centrosomal protein of 44 kDa isoform X1 [Gadus chalcogrammus]XP_056441575.1 centrosomal protein of 44 kDa isoform X1 [Gadus chalcogrammus]XP_056441579.1 centrosomal protein of 44 kDa isoform X1 [Gadus chalcogrammus]XP_056441580.1 centrosomal protein of 44 kDa isoform X1 [Gadus chalcogrammus]
MSTGDLKGALRKLDSLLRAMKYPRDVDYNGLSKGDPSAFLPIVDFSLTTFSPLLTAQLITAEFELTGKTDLRFTDTVYKVLRDVFQYKPVLTKQQFLQCGFSQSKIAVICDIINLVLQRHKQLKKEKLCKEPYSGKTAGDAQPLSRHSCYKENDGPLNSPGTLNGQRMNEGKEDKELPDKRRSQVPPVEERISSLEASLESFALVIERLPTLGTQLESLPMALERLSTLGTRLEGLPLALDKLSTLETRLAKLETHLEKGTACGCPYKNQDLVTISKENWDNLQSRVLLLETKLELASIQRGPLEGSHEHKQAVTQVQPSSLTFSPPLSCPQKDDLQDRLERITSMMKNTSSLLKISDVSI